MDVKLKNTDLLDDFELKILEEAFGQIDMIVDRYTKSGALISLWCSMSDLIEHNEDNKKT